ncbi:hypothetical protein XELAEV_18009593mg [Xenopus laevis]|uniref:Uncharacterized protein n=1 Tax=Xenopus laevis TaxID=8355 RepID=A0A974DSV3_XENLA|nr:hypothetical protein XELAEV_18009593mg [Xenopus laevis]
MRWGIIENEALAFIWAPPLSGPGESAGRSDLGESRHSSPLSQLGEASVCGSLDGGSGKVSTQGKSVGTGPGSSSRLSTLDVLGDEPVGEGGLQVAALPAAHQSMRQSAVEKTSRDGFSVEVPAVQGFSYHFSTFPSWLEKD